DLASMVIPVGVKADANKEITFSAEAMNLPTGIKVFLEDRVHNTFTRLDEANATYKVTLTEALDGVGRFYVHTTQSALSIDNVTLTGVSIFKANAATLRVTGLTQGKASISLFNVLGKQVMSTSFEATASKDISLPKLARGIYFVKVQTATGELSKKIILE
ncbi:T9SS type A sorting domain-containing protein, partial [uncultured Polaribacter sp.]|uniref:T9SS type A sorting domain-containing protein n=1 Tax=uncultured Polaribacter sp. TaxID=174711 RepID=UPI00262C9E12